MPLLFFLATSCNGGGSSEPPKPTASIDSLKAYYIEDVYFNVNPDEGVNLETEVHIVDNETNVSVLCSGVDNGLQHVQHKDTTYDDLEANFIATSQTSLSVISDFYVVLVERDSSQCPNPVEFNSDTILGRSAVFELTLPEDQQIEMKEDGDATISFSKRSDNGTNFNVSELTNLGLALLNISDIYSDEFSQPEVEIHFVDVLTNRDIACEEVVDYDSDQVGTDFTNLALKPSLVNGISGTDTASLVRIVLIERDDGGCPSPFTVGKDGILGTSRALTSTELFSGEKMTFPENYANLQLISSN